MKAMNEEDIRKEHNNQVHAIYEEIVTMYGKPMPDVWRSNQISFLIDKIAELRLVLDNQAKMIGSLIQQVEQLSEKQNRRIITR